ncbi:MAG: T9SS C-terminal target domain-containing protein, partial [Ignavibacteriales bacterium]
DDMDYVMRRDSSFHLPNNEEIYYKKNAMYGDTWENVYPSQTHFYSIIDTAQDIVFGKETTLKFLYITNQSLLEQYQVWTEEFGLLADDHGEGFYTQILKGCIIDGILYGDTIVTSILDEENLVINFAISQNYPNPFNSSTTIDYEINSQSFINLSVYNLLGECISKLVNEVQPSGKYKTKFNAENISSGIYFYKLTDGNKSIINKMILLK